MIVTIQSLNLIVVNKWFRHKMTITHLQGFNRILINTIVIKVGLGANFQLQNACHWQKQLEYKLFVQASQVIP